MPSTHVWLLDRGGPSTEAEVRPWLEAVARDPATSPLPRFLIALLAWVWSHWAARRVIPVCRQLSAPAPQLSDVREQARKLQQVLGSRYKVHPVFRRGGEDTGSARGALGPSDQVVLLPMHPQRHPVAHSAALTDAWNALSGAPMATTAVDAWGLDQAMLALLARRIREALIELRDAGPTCLILAATAPPRAGTRTADQYLAELAETAARVRGQVGMDGPVVQAWIPALTDGHTFPPTVSAAIRRCREQGSQAAIVVPLGCTTSWPELRTCRADHLEAETGIERVRILAPLAPSTDFARVLAQLVRKAEREAGWTVPEDTIQAEVEAELRAAGHPLISERAG